MLKVMSQAVKTNNLIPVYCVTNLPEYTYATSPDHNHLSPTAEFAITPLLKSHS